MAQRIAKFEFDNMIIYDIRSVDTDTDFVTITVTVGNDDPISKTMAMGDLKPGNYPVDLSIEIPLPETPTPVGFAYAVVNNGHASEGVVQKGVEAGLSALLKKGAGILAQDISQPIGQSLGAAIGGAIGTAIVPLIGTAIGALAGYLASTVFGIIFADCDGTVAAGVRFYTSTQLIGMTSGTSVVNDSVNSPGTDSAWGCGSNSEYLCNTTISAFDAIATVFDINGHYNAGGQPGPVITTSGNAIAIDMSAYKRPNATGVIISPTLANITFSDDKSVPNGAYTVQIQAPGTLYFEQNKSSWTKASSVVGKFPVSFPIFRPVAAAPVTPVTPVTPVNPIKPVVPIKEPIHPIKIEPK